MIERFTSFFQIEPCVSPAYQRGVKRDFQRIKGYRTVDDRLLAAPIGNSIKSLGELGEGKSPSATTGEGVQ